MKKAYFLLTDDKAKVLWSYCI